MNTGLRRRSSVLGIILSMLLVLAACSSDNSGGNNNNNNGNNPIPAITTLASAAAIVGSPARALTINGSGFLTTSTVTFNGMAATPTYVSSTQLTILLTTGQLSAPGSFPVIVTNPTPGGGASNAVNFIVNYPTPEITSLSPPSATAGSPALTLWIYGGGFASYSTVTVNNTAAAVTYVSLSELTIQLTTTELASAGTLAIQVTNPTSNLVPGGGASNTVNFNVTAAGINPVPAISSFTPTSLTAGTTGPQTVYINGTGFLSSSTVTFNGMAIAATYATSTVLTISLTTADLLTAGHYPVVVTNPAPGGGASNSLNFNVTSANNSCPYTGNSELLNGQYAFILTGYNSSSYSGFLGVVGSFTVNGAGGITAGEVDSNGALGVQNASINTTTSSYSVGPTGDGCLTIATSFYTFTTRIALNTTTNTVTQGTVIEWESGPNPYIAAGQFFPQTLPNTPSGAYVTVQSGTYNQAGRLALVSALTFNGGSVTGEYASNAGGTVDGGGAGPISLTGTYGTTVDANGRTTSTTTSSLSTTHRAAYVVSSNQFLSITTDTPGTNIAVLTGMGFAKNESPSLITGSNVAIFQLGLNTSTSSSSISGGAAELGLVNITSSSSLSSTEYNYLVGIYAGAGIRTCSYSIDTLGRLALSDASCGTYPPIFYLSGADAGVMMSTDSGAGIGQAFQQTATSVTGGDYIIGTYAVPNVNITETEVGEGVLTSAPVLTGTADYTSFTQLQQSDESVGTTGTLSVGADGTITNSSYPGDVSGLVVSPTQLILVDGGRSLYPAILLVTAYPNIG